MQAVRVVITEKIILAPAYYKMTLLAPEVAGEAKPGQFIQIKATPSASCDPLLPRPISIYQIDRFSGTITILFKEVGRGTNLLAGRGRGELLDIFGPLGKGFTVPETSRKIALVAGGVGMPPLVALAGTLSSREVSFFYGARNRAELLELEKRSAEKISVFTATDDGSYGYRGLVTALFGEFILKNNYDYLAACGPKPMLRALQQLALTRGLAGEFSLESYMACGVGACLGCVCATKTGYRRVCADGPVFNLNEVVFDE